ncbi:glycoside hydrolase family 28 protein [Oidiodendron maius Zn]|uniref:Glycoside hydrolase family 28 protein n=1 Tax=Oidiodendron maius (strain Zn) TaxID=913774 RepID=A0A0C3GP39_OIDMZ|nr:glycoside hydrolase family 28 protein [Oidiodendron maius Zn]
MIFVQPILAVGVLALTAYAQSPVQSPGQACHGNQLDVYPIPSGMPTKNSFSINVRSQYGEWYPLGSYLTTLALENTTTGAAAIMDSSMAYFDFCGTVDIAITYNGGRVDSSQIRPLSYGIIPQVQGNTIKFTLTEPRNLVIQVNDDIFDCLHLMTNTIDMDVPSPSDPSVIYFGPGMHNVTSANNTLMVPSNKTVYLAGGAVLKAGVTFANVSNSILRGRGILYNVPVGAVLVAYSNNITVDGVTMLDPPNGYSLEVGQSDGVVVRNIHSFSSRGNGDGIDLFCTQNILIEGVFMRNSDDCIALYQSRPGWGFYGNSSNITIRNSSLWADIAHPFVAGTHGNTVNPETMTGVTIQNVDILDQREMQMWYQGCIALNAGDLNLLQDFRIEDIRVEDIRLGQLVNFRVMENPMYNTYPGRGIRDIVVKDLTYTGTHANPSLILGYDETHLIHNVTFDNLTVNGLQISSSMEKPSWYLTSDYVPMFANEHVTNLTFNPTTL